MIIRGFSPVVAALSLVAAAHAQQLQPGVHFIENWDMNADGQVTLAEAQEKRGELFYMFDQDEDGMLSDAEYDLFDETRKADMDENAGGHDKGQMRGVNKGLTREFNDSDGDGQVSQDEFIANAEAWFNMMDRNGDGIVTTADFGRKGG